MINDDKRQPSDILCLKLVADVVDNNDCDDDDKIRRSDDDDNS